MLKTTEHLGVNAKKFCLLKGMLCKSRMRRPVSWSFAAKDIELRRSFRRRVLKILLVSNRAKSLGVIHDSLIYALFI